MSEIAELRERLSDMKKYELTEYDVTLTQERAAEIVAEYDLMTDRILELETALADARREKDAMTAVVEAVGRAAAADDKIQEAYNSESVESAFKDYGPVFEQAVVDAIDAYRARAKEGASSPEPTQRPSGTFTEYPAMSVSQLPFPGFSNLNSVPTPVVVERLESLGATTSSPRIATVLRELRTLIDALSVISGTPGDINVTLTGDIIDNGIGTLSIMGLTLTVSPAVGAAPIDETLIDDTTVDDGN